MIEKQSLLGKTLVELQQVVKELGMPQFTAKQIAEWIYVKRVTSFDEMSNLSKNARQQLDNAYTVGRQASQIAQ